MFVQETFVQANVTVRHDTAHHDNFPILMFSVCFDWLCFCYSGVTIINSYKLRLLDPQRHTFPSSKGWKLNARAPLDLLMVTRGCFSVCSTNSTIIAPAYPWLVTTLPGYFSVTASSISPSHLPSAHPCVCSSSALLCRQLSCGM